jgi:hypothetical protein
LTILPGTAKPPAVKATAAEEPPTPEYSSREVKPAALLLRDLLRGHSIFLLHHTSSLSALFAGTKRSKFLSVLGRYWDSFLSTWNVLMHGNPANDLFGGIKIAACGELGVGVGEEERGSGEREVLEGFVGRVDGLVDLVVSKFGNGDSSDELEKSVPEKDAQRKVKPTEPWLGSGDDPAAEDGAIFLGTGALSRKSLRDISQWIEDLYKWGTHAYGVGYNPTSTRRIRDSRAKSRLKRSELSSSTEQSSRQTSRGRSRKESREPSPGPMNTLPPTPIDEGDPANKQLHVDRGQPDGDSIGNKFVQYLKFGYGTHWSVGGTPSKIERREVITDEPSGNTGEGATTNPIVSDSAQISSQLANSPDVTDDSKGHYMIGLLGDVEDETDEDLIASDGVGHHSRLPLRTLTVQLEREAESLHETGISGVLHNTRDGGAPSTATDPQDQNRAKTLRVVVYVNKPFIFVLLFDLGTQPLAFSSLYRSLHHQIGPLIKPLITSTSFRASKPNIEANGRGDPVTPIYDLVWDPNLLTIASNIPNIPDPYPTYSKTHKKIPWTRIEALNTHMQIINTRVSAAEGVEKERTGKTSRGWWVVWTRVPDIDYQKDVRASRGTSRRTSTSEQDQLSVDKSQPKGKEIFLIRRASDNVGGKLSSRLVSGASGSGDVGWAGGPSRLAQGIGIDTTRYIESLLNLAG